MSIRSKLFRGAAVAVVTVVMNGGIHSAFAAGPSLVVTPSSGLHDLQLVHFDAHGLTPQGIVAPRLCVGGSTQLDTCSGSLVVQADGVGDASGDVSVEHRISDSLSCYAMSCAMTLFDIGGNVLASSPATFAVQAGALKRGVNAVAPTAFAGAGSTIGNDGSGWAPNTLVGVLGCRAHPSSLNDCEVSNQQFQEVGADGLLHSAVFSIDPVMAPNSGPPVDCAAATGACVAVAYDVRSFAQSFVETPLSVVLPFAGDLTTNANQIDPTALTHFDGTGWQAYSFVSYEQCRAGGSCVLLGSTSVDSGGNLTFDVALSRELNDGGPWCSIAVSCRLRVIDSRYPPGVFAEIPLFFVSWTLSISPVTGLVDGQQVTISGSKFDPWKTFSVVQCAGQVCVDDGDTVSSDIAGALSGTTVVRDTVPDGHGWFIDCTAARGACSLRIVGGGTSIQSPLHFSSGVNIVMSTYSPEEYGVILGAANQLNLSASEYQRTASWAVAFMFGVAGVTSVAPVAPSGPMGVTTTYSRPELRMLSDRAASVGVTMADFQKLSSYAVAYLLSIS